MKKLKSNTDCPKAVISSIPSLPEHFAEQVLDSETDLDLDCTLATILKLMELYSSAIEHYESIGDPRYLHYQERLQNLLARKDVITLLNMGSPNSISRSKPSEILKKMQEQVAIRQKFRSHQVGMFMTHCLSESRVAEHVLTKHRSENNMAREKVLENIRSQESPDLEFRAQERRRRSGTPVNKLSRTFTFKSPQAKRIEGYQEEIEEIVEGCAREKDERRKVCRKKFKEEIKNLRSMGNGGIFAQVIEEIRKRMNQEIDQIDEDVQKKKKELVDCVKAKYV